MNLLNATFNKYSGFLNSEQNNNYKNTKLGRYLKKAGEIKPSFLQKIDDFNFSSFGKKYFQLYSNNFNNS